ncbi:esterase-like activity of phytase family protein [Sphingomonas crocodyli]|uniref:Esterase-like activity of phytase family protein n=1 Tax=Sphingomonas crocodyli TaxID=1979270 RepID=A0A437LZS9_9SPHN|nr:esterase-like activity of phytase family protein [Sphingomonas crocodyli]RVT90902.1 esterase-like activity of phytase family protein [Sphingomonas crocodyli]
MKIAAILALSCVLAAPADAESPAFTTPHLETRPGDHVVTLDGRRFVNHGLVGVGRLSADTRDFAGETLGSFSAMAVDKAGWKRLRDGSYTGTIWTMPDRGPNDVGSVAGTLDYRNRINRFTIRFKPYTGKADLPQATASQSQLRLTPAGGFFLTDADGQPMTGKEPGSNVVMRDGVAMPSPASGDGAGRISLDSEGLVMAPDGSLYVSDEYAASIYHFDARGRLIGAIPAVPALMPRTDGRIDFNSIKPGDSGRRNNQGLEALSITPDGRHLVTILQSATVQDSDGKAAQMRNATRILLYDVGKEPTPRAPVGHYVLELPTYTEAGDGGAVDRTAAQSEVVALNDHQFLVLARDAIGRGATVSPSKTPVVKTILLVDTTGATNLAGSIYETGVEPVAHKGQVIAGIIPVRAVELINMLNPAQLRRFGMNIDTLPSTPTSLSEKQEAMSLLPALDPKAPDDYFLLVGNDNDFEAHDGLAAGIPFDASLHGQHGADNNDNVVLVYRLTLSR